MQVNALPDVALDSPRKSRSSLVTRKDIHFPISISRFNRIDSTYRGKPEHTGPLGVCAVNKNAPYQYYGYFGINYADYV